MTLPVVKATVLRGNTEPVPRAFFKIWLCGEGFEPVVGYTDDGVEIKNPVKGVADADGSWSRGLYANARIRPSGTRWAIVDAAQPTEPRCFLMPDDEAEHVLEDILSDPPGALASPQLQQEIERATEAEEALGVRIDDEIDRATVREDEIEAALLQEVADRESTVGIAPVGVVGDNVTDDTAALQSWLNAITPGSRLVLPKPAVAYRVTAQLNVTAKSDFTIDGLNSLINFDCTDPSVDGAIRVLQLDTCTDFRVTGFNIDVIDQTPTSYTGIRTIGACTDFEIDHNRVNNARQYGIYARDPVPGTCKRGKIHHNTTTYCRFGIGTNGDHISIASNNVAMYWHTTQEAIDNGGVWPADSLYWDGIRLNPGATNCTVIDNDITESGQSGIYGESASDCTIVANRVTRSVNLGIDFYLCTRFTATANAVVDSDRAQMHFADCTGGGAFGNTLVSTDATRNYGCLTMIGTCVGVSYIGNYVSQAHATAPGIQLRDASVTGNTVALNTVSAAVPYDGNASLYRDATNHLNTNDLLIASLGFKVPNAIPLKARNASDSADIDLIKLDANDNIFIGVSGQSLQVTTGGLVIKNAGSLYGRNAANSTSVPLIGVTAGDLIALGSTLAAIDMISPRLTLPAATATTASLRVSPGVAPTSPVNGDVWTTTSGVFAQINGATVGPLISALLANNTPLRGRNAANNGNVDLIKLDANDDIFIGVTGQQLQITTAGPVMKNDGYLFGRNVANNQSLRLIGIGVSDEVSLGNSTSPVNMVSPRLTLLASTTTTAGLRMPHGSAPTSPVDGDIWTTTGGIFARINGTTETLLTRLANNVALKGRNAANSADVNLIKLDTNDNIFIGVTGQSLQITTSGPVMGNNAYIFGRNAANSNSLRCIGIDTSDQVSLGNSTSPISVLSPRTVFPAGTTSNAPIRLPHGVAPTSPVDGDMWTTSAGGLFIRINGVTKTVTLT